MDGQAKKTVKKEHRLTICEITQETNAKLFAGWSDEEKAALSKGADEILAVILLKLGQANFVPQEAHCIVHDKDTRNRWDERLQSYVVENKLRHFHCYIKFSKIDGKLQSGTVGQIAKAVGVEPQYVVKGPAGRYGWDNMLSYAIHAKDAHKYQYNPADVASGGLFDIDPATGLQRNCFTPYAEIYALRKLDWEQGKAKKTAQRATLQIDDLEAKILCGELTKNQVLLTDSLYDVYARNKRRCDDAFDTYTARKIAKTVQAMENGEFKLSVYFVTGRSHAGKSYFTDALAKRIKADALQKLGQDWTICECAATNPFDDYDGGEILIMDDLRGVAMGASDWLKLLDPDRICIGSARYRNKRIAVRVVIINSEKDLLDFFFYLKGSGGGDRSEALDQFFRRILARVIVYRVPDDMDVRRLKIGHMQETKPYALKSPGDDHDMLTLHHNFGNAVDLSFDDALDHLSDTVMSRNKSH